MAKKLLLAFSVLLMMVSASCGGGSRTMEEIRIEKVLPIGTVPFEGPLLYQKGQELVGPDAQLGEQILQKIRSAIGETVGSREIEIIWATRSYGGLVPALENKEIDVVLGVFGITEGRKSQVAFSKPYYTSELVLVINPVHQDIGVDQIEGRSIGVREGTAIEELVQQKFSTSKTVPFETLDDAILALRSFEIDAVIDDRYMAAYSLDTVPGVAHMEIVPGNMGAVECAVAVRQEDTELLGIIDSVIAQMKTDDSYSQWLNEETGGDLVARVEKRHADRLENARLAQKPRQLVIKVSKDADYDFDIYRMANLSFRITDQESGKSYVSSRIDFKGRVGISSATLPPAIYKIVLPKMNNWSPGSVQIRAADSDEITVNIRLQQGGTVTMTRS
jgi:arginine transport system substrate-binding protein